MVWKILITLLLTAVTALLLHALRSSLLLPVPLGRTTTLRIVLTVRGSAPELEQTVDALQWLRANRTLCGEICIRCADADAETRAVAKLLCRRGTIKILNE